VPTEKVDRQTKIFSNYSHIMKIADHYNIFKDLFEQGYFRPCLDLCVQYTHENRTQKVFYGNRIPAILVYLNVFIFLYLPSILIASL
jgi:hypothetical protein